MRVLVLILSAILIVAGITFAYLGFNARNEVRNTLAAEQLNVPDPRILLTYPDATAPDGVTVPTVLVDTPELAVAEANVIQTHVMGITGGKTYAQMDREDPARATYLNAVTLRSSLMQARMAFDISTLVMGLGALFTVTGVAIAGIFVLAFRPGFARIERRVHREAHSPSAA